MPMRMLEPTNMMQLVVAVVALKMVDGRSRVLLYLLFLAFLLNLVSHGA